jgi:Fe-S-cluster containining protein
MSSRECDEVMEFSFQLRVGNEVLETHGKLHDGSLSIREFLPMLQNLTDWVMGSLSRQAQAEGRQISCKAGCGACCRQAVPISEEEALSLIELLSAMPKERQTSVLARFEAALMRLKEAGLLEKLCAVPEFSSREDRQSIGIEYFKLNIPCPFLENESCSIHPDRPLSCREYLVTSPAESCSSPGPQRIAPVDVPHRLSNLFFRLEGDAEKKTTRWLPLILALEAASRLRERPETKFPGKQLMETVVQYLNH